MFVGIDIGTQSLKAIVTDDTFRPLAEATRCYQPDFPQPGWAEQSPSLWEETLGPAIAEALTTASISPDAVRGISVCGQLDGCLPVDENGSPIGNCVIWMDRRAEAELADVDAQLVRQRGGIMADASHFAAKARWLKRHHTVATKLARYHGPVSFMVERLTGRAVMDHAVASTTMLYDLNARDYDDALLNAFELTRSELPEIGDAFERAASLSARGASLSGLPKGIPVAIGTGDDFSTPLGAGLVNPGDIAVVLGTGEVVAGLTSQSIIDHGDLVETHGYPSGGYMLENPGWLCGGSLAWAMNLLKVDTAAAFDALAAQAPPGSDGVLFIPALTGAMSPRWISSARGCFYGLTPAHGPQHMARAVMEGCAFSMRDVVDRLKQLGIDAQRLSLLAGGSRSTFWAQMRADVSGLPVTTPAHVHTSAIAAAMLAGVAAGEHASLRQAATLAAPPAETWHPEASGRDALMTAYERYRRLCDSLEPIFRNTSTPSIQ